MKHLHLPFRSTLLALVLVSPIGAQSLDCVSGGSTLAWGEARYWRPADSATGWAMRFTGPSLQDFGADGSQPSGAYTVTTVCHDYNVGVSYGTRYFFDWSCLFFEVSGGYIQFVDGSSSTGELTSLLSLQSAYLDQSQEILNPALPIVGEGRGDLRSRYWTIDLRIGWASSQVRETGYFVHGGVRYANLEERLSTQILGNTLVYSILQGDFVLRPVDLQQRRRMEFSGAGPELGIGGRFDLWRCLGVEIEGAAVALIGKRRTNGQANIEGLLVQSNQPVSYAANQRFSGNGCVAIVPGFTTKLALSIAFSWYCLEFEGRLGYQTDYYWDIFNQTLGSVNVNPGLIAQPNLRDAGFAGPFLGGSIRY